MTSKILEPGQIEQPHGEIPFIRLPERKTLFRQRANRLRGLAEGHTIADFLNFMAQLADVQQGAIDSFPEVFLPDAPMLDLCREHGMPPLPARSWLRNPAWRRGLKRMIAALVAEATPQARDAMVRLYAMTPAELEAFADNILSEQQQSLDLALAPLVAAALQVYWTHMATTLGAQAFGRGDIANLCPVCASPPVASVVRIGGSEQGLRYLHCSLCGTEWHMVRVKCSNCEESKGLAYFGVEGAPETVKAEACDDCGSYLKIVYMEKDPHVEPVADDIATLALDVLMNETGKPRSGPNLMLFSAGLDL
ncbi:protein FdhE [Sulfurimicrobium lacus]|uniref:Protein FdhE homolog n=2 Tax=Sulfurimicrobium lacus TaxID=2715678 RepID=A0A6F8VFJ8_9PROT|nr:protein FdhE [Sulfurimicrobium lacus]